MDANFFPSNADIMRILPEIILTLAGTLLLLVEGFLKDGDDRGMVANLTFAAIAGAMAASVMAYGNPGTGFYGMIVSDGFAAFFRIVALAVGLLTVLCSGAYLKREHAYTGEFYILLLFSLAGQCLMAASNELMMVFIGLEVSSIASYILAGYLRDDKRGNESAIKYFLLGSFATAFLLYGVSWIYGMTGTTNLTAIREALTKGVPSETMVAASAALMLIGFAFKVSAAPFQIWAPDVYQGAPAPVAGFLSAGPKAAAFAIMIRVFLTAFEPLTAKWAPVLWMLALATMIAGNFAALWQSNIKRMLGYSSIAHAGYVLVAITTHSVTGTAAAMFYLAAYALMNFGAFAAVTHVAGKGEKHVTLDDLKGLSQRQPGVAAILTIFMLSLIGVPLTAGFFGKFYIFKAAIEGKLVWLTALGLLNSAVAAYYYLRVLVVMYMHDPETTEPAEEIPGGIKVTMWLTAAATLVLGVFPGLVLDFANQFAVLGR
ncbi:MAG: NADH-quinone oxidoreductase subunit N [Acidobacteria bacterium]|nr:NADH-quinone oxidoreductase subunit N [Acidobacteriota bacterium]